MITYKPKMAATFDIAYVALVAMEINMTPRGFT